MCTTTTMGALNREREWVSDSGSGSGGWRRRGVEVWSSARFLSTSSRWLIEGGVRSVLLPAVLHSVLTHAVASFPSACLKATHLRARSNQLRSRSSIAVRCTLYRLLCYTVSVSRCHVSSTGDGR